jgi:hypothetical protein
MAPPTVRAASDSGSVNPQELEERKESACNSAQLQAGGSARPASSGHELASFRGRTSERELIIFIQLFLFGIAGTLLLHLIHTAYQFIQPRLAARHCNAIAWAWSRMGQSSQRTAHSWLKASS